MSVLFLFATYSYAQKERKANLNSSTIVEKKANPDVLVYQLYPTQNMWNFIKLDTRNGKMWQVQFDIEGNNRFETDLNSLPLVFGSNEINGRFALHPTQNMYNFLLLDQIDGRVWQVQWAIEQANRFILQIY